MSRLSVVMPVHNAEESVARAIYSVLDTPRKHELEIVVVDDCSTDGTAGIVQEIARTEPSVLYHCLPENSGSPSKPRNWGIEAATGDYITFLDDDDWVDAGRLLEMLDEAAARDLDFLKGYLYVVNGSKQTISNYLQHVPEDSAALRREMVEKLSTTQDFLVRRSLLMDHDLRYDPSIRIGEDTLFIFSILAKSHTIGYIQKQYLYYNKSPSNRANLSSTQQCGDREVLNQVEVWHRAEQICQEMGLSFYALRLHIGLRQLLMNIVHFSDGISEETYDALRRFVQLAKKRLGNRLYLIPRYQQLYDTLLKGRYPDFLQQARRRLLIAGYDLKFALPLVPYLEQHYAVAVDEWTGHATHDAATSRKHTEWADIIWCEWLLENAVFYADILKPHQRMVIRAHRFELWRDAGSRVNYDKVSSVLAVGYYYFEQFAAKFDIPRGKMRLLPNYVEEGIYSTEKTPEARYTIGLAGMLPARKGLMRALELLNQLRRKDERYRLCVMGATPEDTPWIQKDEIERQYFEACAEYARENGLEEHVRYGGFVDRSQVYRDMGFVLSVSDAEAPESFHLAPAEGACAGCMGLLLNWPGVEYLYPDWAIFANVDEMAAEIGKATNDVDYFATRSRELRDYVKKNYGMGLFMERVTTYLRHLFLME